MLLYSMRNNKSIGVSKRAFQLETQYDMFHTKFLSVLTLQEIADSVSAYYNTNDVTVVFSKALGKGLTVECRGKFVYGRDGKCHIRVGDKGLNLATILHEMAHYIDWDKHGFSGHAKPFQSIHEETISWYGEYKLEGLAELTEADELNFYWERFPQIYRGKNIGDITEKDLLESLRQTLKHAWDFRQNVKEEVAQEIIDKPIPDDFYGKVIKTPTQTVSPIDMFRRLRNE